MQDMENRRPPHGSAAALRAAATRDKPQKPTLRVYTAEYKTRILDELAELRISGERGAIGALLRREGLNPVAPSRWEKAREAGRLVPQKRGRKVTRDPVADENARLQEHIAKLEQKLRKAELIIDVQKKLGALLGIEMATDSDKDGTS